MYCLFCLPYDPNATGVSIRFFKDGADNYYVQGNENTVIDLPGSIRKTSPGISCPNCSSALSEVSSRDLLSLLITGLKDLNG